MLLNELFKQAPAIQIDQLSCESRIPMKNCIFFCIKGVKYNGHEYIDEAIRNGANVIIYSDNIEINTNAIYIKVKNVLNVLIKAGRLLYGLSNSSINTYVTAGSYGKSSVSNIIYEILNKIETCAYIGSYGIKYNETVLASNVTTLTVLDNLKYTKACVDEGIKNMTLEASSLGLSYRKLDFITPCSYIYTNTDEDSSDYSKVDKKYYDIHLQYLYTLPEETLIVLNKDDVFYDELSKAASSNQITYGKDIYSDYQIMDIKLSSNSTSFIIKENNFSYPIATKLLGEINVYNIAAAFAALRKNGFDPNDLVQTISLIEPLDGVMDHGFEIDGYNLVVDRADSFNSIKNVLNYASRVTPKKNSIITILDIDETKSKKEIISIMELLKEKVDMIILTSNDLIEFKTRESIKLAESLLNGKKFISVEDRQTAIEQGVELLNRNDFLVILGKGKDNFIYNGYDKIAYEGDKNLAIKYMNVRKKKENEAIQIY